MEHGSRADISQSEMGNSQSDLKDYGPQPIVVKMGSSKDNIEFQVNAHDDFAIIIPDGAWHNIINTGDKPLKVYSIYAPPQHPHSVVQVTKPASE